ncbi:MAG: hypothetical protein QOH58_2831 [Thermoleophilaceae bacterium]|jgi:pimeloyl-ACP methyl ester carboxylesterase|nr:hypothetical protein [Thermoleophilaceae bacterium]
MTRGRRLAGLALAAVVLALPAPAQAALRFHDCRGQSCARLAVPLDRSGSASGRVSLYVERRRAARRPRRGVTLLLAGGPGQPATLAYGGPTPEQSYREFAALTPANDIVTFDQRGTGRSGLLRCPRLERANLADAGAEAADCAARLGPRRAFYRTSDTVDDIEALRAALGARKLTLVGVSYGTLVAQAYAARHPDRVERVLLDSVLDVAGWDPLYGDIFRAVPRVLRSVCRRGCASFTSDPVADAGRLVAALANAPLRGRVTLPDGRRRRSSLSREELFFTLVAGDLDPVSRYAYPAAVTSALAGDAAPLLRLKRRAVVSESSGTPREFSTALYAATACEEIPFPWARFSPPAERPAAVLAAAAGIPPAQLFPFDAATAAGNDFIRLCERWPEASPPPAPPPPPGSLPDVPVLMLAGEADLRTPAEAASRAAADWPDAHALVVPDTGHSVLTADLTPCARNATRRFFRGGSVPQRCRRQPFFVATPPLPASLDLLRPVRGVPGARGRVVRAVEQTLYDVAEDFVASVLTGGAGLRGGGLRGGRWHFELGHGRLLMRLERVELVRGVEVSGTIRRFGERGQRARLRVSGEAGPGGTLLLRANRVSGRLGGRSVRARIGIGVVEDAAAAAAAPRSLAGLLRVGRRLAQRPRMR